VLDYYSIKITFSLRLWDQYYDTVNRICLVKWCVTFFSLVSMHLYPTILLGLFLAMCDPKMVYSGAHICLLMHLSHPSNTSTSTISAYLLAIKRIKLRVHKTIILSQILICDSSTILTLPRFGFDIFRSKALYFTKYILNMQH
jgi:hypothetical protein